MARAAPPSVAPAKKPSPVRKKPKPMGPREVEVALADLVMPKRMASLNASAILAASSQQWTSERRRRRRDTRSSEDEDSTTSGSISLQFSSVENQLNYNNNNKKWVCGARGQHVSSNGREGEGR